MKATYIQIEKEVIITIHPFYVRNNVASFTNVKFN